MLEVRNLTKTYKPKKGVPVLAVDHINLKFPDTGMIFLLGKSGSGKSTMLNLLGGLDVYDDGEIVIKGKSSKDFKQQDFDSYRNTYLGFIFQEYNVLEDFNVGANIGLALELQGKKATDDDINRILKEVDLEGFGERKPNELSGGQKQRVAIARALVKDPEIIMADEPTGALDSATGRQVLDTLKKLSGDKLVIVVSHDREFAEKYADRIIEMADGHVISDVTYTKAPDSDVAESDEFDLNEFGSDVSGSEDSDSNAEVETRNLVYGENQIAIAPHYHLTELDRIAINEWIDAHQGGVSLVMRENQSVGAPKAARVAVATDESRIVNLKNSGFELIKSKLPMKEAFRIGVSGLKHKKFRLVVTILLACVALGLFGLADTMGSYDHIRTCTNSIADSNITYATFSRAEKKGSGNNSYWDSYGYKLNEEDIARINAESGVQVTGVYMPTNMATDFMTQYDENVQFTETDYHIYAYGFSGFVDLSQETLDACGMTLIEGKLADGTKNEMVISKYLAQTFIIGGYREPDSTGAFIKINRPADLIGKTIRLGSEDFVITGIVDTGFDLSRYVGLTKLNNDETTADKLIDYALYNEISSARGYSYIQMAMLGEGGVERLRAAEKKVYSSTKNGFCEFYKEDGTKYTDIYPNYFAKLDEVDDSDIVWAEDFSGKTLGEKDLIVSENMLYEYSLISKDEAFLSIDGLRAAGYLWDAGDGQQNYELSEDGYRIVGYLKESAGYVQTVIANDTIFQNFADLSNGIYSYACGAMPESKSEIQSIVKFANTDYDGVRYELQNSAVYELDGLDSIFKTVSKIFIWIGVFFAIFASVMMATFISSSIAYKKQEIGILRAIGARGSDVFRIFFSESFVIAMIEFVLAAIGTGLATALMNYVFRHEVGILVTVLTFNYRQVVLLFVISTVVAALASFFPVNHNAKKRPIDAIRNR